MDKNTSISYSTITIYKYTSFDTVRTYAYAPDSTITDTLDEIQHFHSSSSIGNQNEIHTSYTSSMIHLYKKKEILRPDESYHNYYENIDNRRGSFSGNRISLVAREHYYESKSEQYIRSPSLIPANQEIYIGVKLLVGSRKHLGWIKIIMNDFHQVTLLETALQR
jgi:hypothetical protein